MSDPFDSLRTGLPMTDQPTAAEIRRRGDARRRRSTALVSVAAVAAVAAVAIPIGLTLGGSQNAVPPAGNSTGPSPTPTDRWLTTIPDSVHLGAGWDTSIATPTVSTNEDNPMSELSLCSSVAPLVAETSDHLYATWATEGDHVERRTLAVFDDDTVAAERLGVIEQAASSCDEVFDLGSTSGVARFGTALEEYAGAAWSVRQVGNAILVVGAYGQGGEVTKKSLTDTIDYADSQAAPLVEQLCAFSAEGCDTEPSQVEVPAWSPKVTAPSLTGTAVSEVADLPVTAGFPNSHEPGTDGLVGPKATTAFELNLCDSDFSSTVDPTDGIGASFADVEYYRSRTVLVFDDASAAADWFGQLYGFIAQCPTEDPIEDGSVSTHALTGIPMGSEGFATRTVAVLDGDIYGTGQDVTTVIRFGRALVLDHEYGEGAFGVQSRALQAQLDSQVDLLGAVQATYGDQAGPAARP